jgi:hypothetical protein
LVKVPLVDGVLDGAGLLAATVGVGCGTGDGVSADACPAVMITTMTEAAIARLVLVEARRQRNWRCFTVAPEMF